MSPAHLLAIVGPSLTTAGAGLLAFDVLQGPMRLSRRQDRTELLVEAKHEHDATSSWAALLQHECDHLVGTLYPMRVRDFSRFGFTSVLFPDLDADGDD